MRPAWSSSIGPLRSPSRPHVAAGSVLLWALLAMGLSRDWGDEDVSDMTERVVAS